MGAIVFKLLLLPFGRLEFDFSRIGRRCVPRFRGVRLQFEADRLGAKPEDFFHGNGAHRQK